MMTDETNRNALKPVRCGCGGEAILNHYCYSYGDDDQYYFVWCERCDIQTKTYHTEAEAIEAWNRAMGNGDKTSQVERTAKMVDYGTDIDAYDIKGVRTWCKKYRCENCGFIQFAIEDHGRYTYCPSCGARLEWE